MGMKGGAEKSWFPCKWAYDDMILLAFDCCNNNNFFCLWYDLEPHLEGGGGSGTAGYPCRSCILHPHAPATIMLAGGDKHPPFDGVLIPGFPSAGLLVNECLQSDGHERGGRKVMVSM